MLIYANGCSWTWGGGLDDSVRELNLTWPHRLAAKIGARAVNDSMGCGSNQRIVRTSFNWLETQHRMSEPTVAVIQFTGLERYEYYDTGTDPSREFQPNNDQWALASAAALVPGKTSPILFKTAERIRNYRLSTYTDTEGQYTLMTQCTALRTMFNRKRIPCYFWSFCLDFSQFNNVVRRYLLSNFNWLDIDQDTLCNRWDYERIGPHDAHPSVRGHDQLADIIKSRLESLRAL